MSALISFMQALEAAENGDFLNHAEEQFREVNKEVQKLKKGGKLVIEIAVKPDDQAENGVIFELDRRATLPKIAKKKPRVFMFTHPGTGAAVVTNPTGRQGEISLPETSSVPEERPPAQVARLVK